MMKRFRVAVCLLLFVLVIGKMSTSSETHAQELLGGKRPTPEMIEAMKRRAMAQAKGRSEGKKPEGEEKDGEKKKDGEDEEENATEEAPEPKVIRRDQLEGKDSDPAELKASLDQDGMVTFQFRNQGWVDLVAWLSDIAQKPIDWQELPGDTVNLISPGRLSLAETYDLMNRHLLSRGYTLLQLNGGVTIAKVDAINPGMVQRVEPERLEQLPDYTYVRAIMDAGWLSSEKLAEELKPMISPSGKLTALSTTNRLEAMDVAVNLRQVARVLLEERDAASRDALAPEFRLRHVPAEEAKQMLMEFLGVQEENSNAPMSRDQMRMMQEMMQRNGGKMPQKPKAEVSIVANVRQNSVLIRAPMDRVAVAAEFIKRIDVPGESMTSLLDVGNRVDVFRLVSLDPEKLIEIVHEMNVLEPTTRISVDKENHAVIASGSAADRFIIKSLVERLDGGKRRLEVLQLRRLDANQVAESIAFLMGKDQDDEDSGRSRRYYYYGYGDDDDEAEEDEFRVAANAKFRQVLLWANESEMEEVRSLLVKLGELPPPGGSRETIRVIEASATPETLEYLQELRQQWEAMSGGTIDLPDASEFVDPTVDESEEGVNEETSTDAEAGESVPATKRAEQTELTTHASTRPLHLVTTPAENELSSEEKNQRSAPGKDFPSGPKVSISLDAAGNLILKSRDTEALDRLESLMLRMSPPRRPYHVFRVKHASPIFLVMDLEDYFKSDEQSESDSDRFFHWYWDLDDEEDAGPTGLAASGELKFVPNSDTGTIVVTGATGEQLKTIQELIRLWDVPEPINPRRSRFTKLVRVKYGRAQNIADTIKDAYRDLLSSNDKAFQAAKGQGGQRNGDQSNLKGGSGLANSDSGRDSGDTNFRFSGKLSIGVDDIGNTLLVSAEGESLLELMEEMIEELDEAAMPGGDVEILKLSGKMAPQALQQAMTAFGAKEPSRDSQQQGRPRGGEGSGGKPRGEPGGS
ncbi:MAG: secretin N-terminal domain-containing protein [Planctomycetota bacterium]